MADLSGVCAVVPKHQHGYRPKVIGMGIVVNDREVVTCAHVVDEAIGEGWFDQPGDGVVRVCFPFVEGSPCVLATVDRKRYFRPDRAEEGKLTDIVVVQLPEPAPKAAGRVVLQKHTDDATVKVYGFRQKELRTGGWESHPSGEVVESKVLGPLPGGRVYFEGLRSTGATVEPGFSGAGVYDPRQGAVVGMVVVASAEVGKSNAQFIDVASLQRALGWTGESPLVQYRSTLRLTATRLDWWERAMPIDAKLQPSEAKLPARQVLRDWVGSDAQHCVLLGSPGSGKSGLLRWLASELACHDDALPLFIPATKLRRPGSLSLGGLAGLAEPPLDPSLLTGEPAWRRLYILLDGLDELVGAEAGGETVAGEILGKLFVAIPVHARVVAACRTLVFAVLGDGLTDSLPSGQSPQETGDIYDVAIDRVLNRPRPPLVVRLLPVRDSDAATFLRTTRLPTALVDAAVVMPTIRPFLASPFSVRLLSLALPRLTTGSAISIIDLYRIYIEAALVREKPDVSRSRLRAIVESLEEFAENPDRRVDGDAARLARNAELLTLSGDRYEFSHYTLWEYLYSSRVHAQMAGYNSRLLSSLDLVNGYNLNRFLVPMTLSLLSAVQHPSDPNPRIVSNREYQDFLRGRGWRRGSGYGIHPSPSVARDGTPAATFSIDSSEIWSVYEQGSPGDPVACAVSWYDAAVFALHAGARLPTTDQLRALGACGDYLFWGAEWFSEDSSHMSAFDARAGRTVGINPDLRLARTAVAVLG